jgi:DNA-binding beta-propeller fold protein YncE
MDEQIGDGMNIKAVLLEALPPGTATNLSTVEELKERIATKRRHRHSTMGTVGVAMVALLLILVLLPFGMSNHPRAIHAGAGRAHRVTPTSPETGLTPVSLPGPYTGYVPSLGPIAISTNGRVAYVGDAHTGLVTPIDLRSGRTQQPIKLGLWGINAIAVAPDGRTAYVVEGGVADAIIPIDLVTRTAGPAIHVAGTRALGSAIAITPDGQMAYVDSLNEYQESPGSVTITHTIPGYVVPIDLTTKKALRPIALEPLNTGGHIVQSQEPPCLTNCGFGETIGGIAIAPNGRTAYVSNTGTQTSGVYPIDLTTERVGSEIATGGVAGPIAVLPNARTAYVAGNEFVTPVDLLSGSAGPSIRVVSQAELFSSMAITPDGHTLVVAGYPELGLVDLQSGAVETPIPNPYGGGDIAIAPAAKSNTSDCRYGKVSVLASLAIPSPSICLHEGATLTVTFDKSAGGLGVPGPWTVPPLGAVDPSVLKLSSRSARGQVLTAALEATGSGTATLSAHFDEECSGDQLTACTIPPQGEIDVGVTVVTP